MSGGLFFLFKLKVLKSLTFDNVTEKEREPGRESSTSGAYFEAMRLWPGPVLNSSTEEGGSEASTAVLGT